MTRTDQLFSAMLTRPYLQTDRHGHREEETDRVTGVFVERMQDEEPGPRAIRRARDVHGKREGGREHRGREGGGRT